MDHELVRSNVGSVDDVHELRRAVGKLQRRLRSETIADALPLTSLSVLGHLADRGAVTAGQLAVLERVQPQSLTRTLNDLEAAGLLRRRIDPDDGRRAQLSLTSAGRAALQREMRPRDEWLSTAIEATLEPLERELLRLATPLLARLAEVG